MWFTEAEGNNIGSVTTSGFIVEYPIPTPNSTPSGITAGPDGAIWFNESASSANQIVRMTTAGQFTIRIRCPVPTAFSGRSSRVRTGISGLRKTAPTKSAGWFRPINPAAASHRVDRAYETRHSDRTDRGPDGAMWFTEFGSSGWAGLPHRESLRNTRPAAQPRRYPGRSLWVRTELCGTPNLSRMPSAACPIVLWVWSRRTAADCLTSTSVWELVPERIGPPQSGRTTCL